MRGSDNDPYDHPLQRKKPSWIPTLVAQLSVCFALFATFTIFMPQTHETINTSGFSGGSVGRSSDLYFLSVRGGSRSVLDQTQLLQQMAMTVKTFNVKFVVIVSEHGEEDPLLRNATQHFALLRVPWYATTTRVHKREGEEHFLQQIAVSPEQTLDIIFLNMGSWQSIKHVEKVSGSSTGQMDWLTKTLAGSSSNWRIIVGFHPLVYCEDQQHSAQNSKPYDHLHNVFLNNRVNIYLSNLGCAGHYSHHSGIAYIGNPSYSDEELKGPANANKSSEMRNSFLLHRVGAFEIESYFINSLGEATSSYTIPQWGRQAM